MGIFQLNDTLNPSQWILDRNAKLKQGSRALIALHQVISLETTPSCYKGSKELIYMPIKEYDVCRIQSDRHGFHANTELRLIDKTIKSKRPQYNASIPLKNIDQNLNFLNIDTIKIEELNFIIRNGHFGSDQSNELNLLTLAKSAVIAEQNSNILALAFLHDEYAKITNKISTTGDSEIDLALLLNDYRCAVRGVELTADVMRYEDIQSKLRKILHLRHSKDEREAFISKVAQWNAKNIGCDISYIGFDGLARSTIYYKQDGVNFKATFSINVHNTPLAGKPKKMNGNDVIQSSFIFNYFE